METGQKRMRKSEVAGKSIQENEIRESEIQTDELTGLYCGNIFYCEVEKYLSGAEGEYCLIAIDLEHFRLFNKLYGRDEGDRLLVKLSEMLKEFSEKKGGIVGYLGGDDFCVLMENDSELIKKFRRGITEEVRGQTSMVGFLPAFGICPIEDKTVPAITLYDRATVALSHVIGNYAKRYCVYSQDMEDKVEREIRLLTEIQEGLRKEEFTFFIQPQCDISTGKIVGGESLVRWQHSTKGLIPPGVFVPILERNGFIATLDRYVWRKVCQWLRSCLDRGFNPVPVSINVSRIDIFSMDVPAYLSELLSEYNLSAKLLKVEITESAYAESNDRIVRTVKQLRDADFLVMMDDFGSGYSSLNMLKSVAVDVLKIDMRFLEIDENEQEKGIGILESVVNMARQMNMPIVVEGVETQKQENFLLKMGCRYMQGYYYYKPMPIEDFEQLLSDGRNLDLNGIWCRQIESVHLREFLDKNLFNDTMINHILGAAAFYDMYENTIEITRVNMQYLKLAGVSSDEEESFHRKFWNHVRDDDRQLLFSIFAQAYDNAAGGSQGYIHYLRADGTVLWVLIRIYFLKERNGHKIFYGSLTDLTALQDKKRQESIMENAPEEMSEKQLNRMEQNFGNLPWGYGLGRVCLDGQGSVRDYDIVYANGEMSRLCGGDKGRLRYLLQKFFEDKQEEMYDKIYRAAYLGETVEQYVYSAISCRYIWVTFYQYQYGYVGCILRDDTRSYIYGTILESVLLSYRGVYFVHLQDNYCRMIYPDRNHMLERGNYEEVVNRHFKTGTIRPYNAENIRRDFSLENLRDVLRKQDTVEYKYKRRVENGGEEWCLASYNVSERQNGIPKTVILAIRSIEALMREKSAQKRLEMAGVLATMSEGFFVYRATGDEKLLYANPAVLKIFGCDSMNELRELVNDSFSGMVYPEDLNRVQWEIQDQVRNSERKMDFIMYRIIRKDGQIRWIDDCGHLEDSGSDEKTKLFYVFISDITDTIKREEKERLIALNHNCVL